MKNNYHTHTPRCNHAVGSEEEYVEKAIESNFSTLGFSDHCPLPDINDARIAIMRMAESEIDSYVYAIETLKKIYKRYIQAPIAWNEKVPEIFRVLFIGSVSNVGVGIKRKS